MAAAVERHAIIVGGPNGAGKTTFVTEYLTHNLYPYLSADLFAAEISPNQPHLAQVAAGRKFLRAFRDKVARRESFVAESTLAGRSLLTSLIGMQRLGYEVSLVFVYLETAELHVRLLRSECAKAGTMCPKWISDDDSSAASRTFGQSTARWRTIGIFFLQRTSRFFQSRLRFQSDICD